MASIELFAQLGRQTRFDGALAHRREVGQAHAVGGEHAGIRVDVDAGHPQGIGDQAGMLAAGATKTLQGVLGDVVAARHRHLFDRVGHVFHRDLDEAFRHGLGRALVAGGFFDLGRQCAKLFFHHRAVQRFAAAAAEHLGKPLLGCTALPSMTLQSVTASGPRRGGMKTGAGVGAGRIRADAIARAVEMQYRAAARRHRVDAHHRRAHPHARHQRRIGKARSYSPA